MTAQLLQRDLADFTIFGPEDEGKHQFHNHASTVGDADGLHCESFSTDLVHVVPASFTVTKNLSFVISACAANRLVIKLYSPKIGSDISCLFAAYSVYYYRNTEAFLF